MTAFYLVGMGITAIASALLFARRYPGHRGWLAIGIGIGLVAMIVWPITLWVALAMWLTGFARPRPQPQQGLLLRKRIALPLATLGSLGSIVVIGATADPVPPTVAESAPPAAVTSAIPTPTPVPLLVPSTIPTPTPTTSPSLVRSRAALVSKIPTTTTTAAPAPRPQPKPQPAPKPKPQPQQRSDQQSQESDEGSASSGTRPRTGNSGHPCRPGERDGDGDGYCGER